MILTVTLNPALDITYHVDTLMPGATHRVARVEERLGGKGLNVASVLRQLGEPVFTTGLMRDPIPAFAPISAALRRTVVVTDGVDATGFWEPGPVVTPQEWAYFAAQFANLVADARVVVFSGSLPTGLPAHSYASLIGIARHAGCKTILDTSGPALGAVDDTAAARPARSSGRLTPPRSSPAGAADGPNPPNDGWLRAAPAPATSRAAAIRATAAYGRGELARCLPIRGPASGEGGHRARQSVEETLRERADPDNPPGVEPTPLMGNLTTRIGRRRISVVASRARPRLCAPVFRDETRIPRMSGLPQHAERALTGCCM